MSSLYMIGMECQEISKFALKEETRLSNGTHVSDNQHSSVRYLTKEVCRYAYYLNQNMYI